MKETLTKENFWDAIEAQYPKAFKIFHDWLITYKEENDWGELFNEFGACSDNNYSEVEAPKYHDLPIAMQYGIFCEFSFNFCTSQGLSIAFIVPFDINKAMPEAVNVTFQALERIHNG